MINRKSKIVNVKSTRYSCANVQKPLEASKGNFVVIKAVIIMINRGIEANLVNNPISRRKPQNISNAPVNYAQKNA